MMNGTSLSRAYIHTRVIKFRDIVNRRGKIVDIGDRRKGKGKQTISDYKPSNITKETPLCIRISKKW